MKKGYLSQIFVSFQGEGAWAGQRQLFIRTAGCHLRCRYCDTPESLERVPFFCVGESARRASVRAANPVTTSETLKYCQELLAVEGTVDGVALTGGEPLLQAEYLKDLLQDNRLPHPRLLETSGTQPERLALVLPWVDIVSMDIKLPSNTNEPAFWDAHEKFLSAARDKAYVKVLIDANTDLAEVEMAAHLVATIAPHAFLFLQPITDACGGTDTDTRALARFFAVTRRHLNNVRLLPQLHKLLRIP